MSSCLFALGQSLYIFPKQLYISKKITTFTLLRSVKVGCASLKIKQILFTRLHYSAFSEGRLRLGKMQVNLLFRSACTTFAAINRMILKDMDNMLATYGTVDLSVRGRGGVACGAYPPL